MKIYMVNKKNKFILAMLAIIVLTSAASADISGKVKNTVDVGISSTVTLVDPTTMRPTAFSAATDASGNFVISGVPAGRYFVRAIPSSGEYLPGETRLSYSDNSSGITILLSASTSSTAEYVGSDACKFCHNFSAIGFQYNSWKNTWHANAIHDPDPSKSGIPKEGVIGDFGQDPVLSETANNISNVIIDLNYDGVNYTVKVGNVTYKVDKVMGGFWKQRYLTKIGNSYYVLPLQWIVATNKWTNYDLNHWFKTDGSNAPIYGEGDTPVSKGNQRNSWERRCAGCHASTGLNVNINSQGEYVATFIEMRVSCESCHGPASRHTILGGGKAKGIIMPNLLTYERANEVCGQCHNRGVSVSTNPMDFDYPYNTGINAGIYKPGLLLDDYFKNYSMKDAAASNFWRADKDYPEEGLRQGDAIAGRAHREQWPDLKGAKHALNGNESVSCMNCHAPHGSSNRLGLVEQNKGKTITNPTSLCLSCHQKMSPFQKGSLIGSVDGDTDHFTGIYDAMKDIGCIECHMVKTDRTAFGPNPITKEFDQPDHTFKSIKPKFSTNGMPNSCTKCHTTGGAATRSTLWSLTEAQKVYDMTNASIRELSSTYVGADFCKICHTNTAGIPQIYNGWNETRHSNAFIRKYLPQVLNASGNDSSIRSCLSCHTVGYLKGGYINYNTTPQLINIQCENCHGPGSKHDVEANISARVCGECHQGERRPTITEWENSRHSKSLERFRGINANTFSQCLICHSGDFRLSKNPTLIPDATNTTKYGITCAVCHNSHSRANPSQLRSVNATQTCAQCHIDYRGPGFEETPHNFQVEMRQGRGGINITSVQFMPTVGCESCHMVTRPYETGSPAITGHTFEPKREACKQCHVTETNQRGENGNDTLIRHTVLNFIRAGRTDCGLCHEKGFSADGYLDTWQSKVSSEINKTQANITLARNATTSQALKNLYNISKFNLDIVNSSDKTTGAHNPDYALAVLRESNRVANQVIGGTIGVVTRYDQNNNGRIEKSEAVQAVSDYFAGIITKQDAIIVVSAYFTG